jgi:HPt (histidine-containing phosphotransfer) domain-containing protein
MMATAQHGPDLVERKQLLALSDQLGPATCHQFISNYTSLWDSRYDRLYRAVTLADDDAAMDVVLSIKISSEMAGAHRLAELARSAQQRLGHSGAAELASMLAVFAACGRETMAYLLATLD